MKGSLMKELLINLMLVTRKGYKLPLQKEHFKVNLIGLTMVNVLASYLVHWLVYHLEMMKALLMDVMSTTMKACGLTFQKE